MSIASEITRLQGVKADILTAIADKGVVVPVGSALDDCAGLIGDIGSGAIPSEYSYYEIGGKTYRAATIMGKTYLAENLDLKWTGLLEGSSNAGNGAIAYYDDDETTYGWNGEKRGGLYDQAASYYLETNKTQLIPGWHVMTEAEMTELTSLFAIPALRGTPSLWSGNDPEKNTNITKFNIYPSGDYNNGFYDKADTFTMRASVSADKILTVGYNQLTIGTYYGAHSFMASIRLVKDAT